MAHTRNSARIPPKVSNFREPERRCGPRTTGVFPLRLGRQPVLHPGLLRQPLAVSHRLVPGDVDHGTTFATPASVVCLLMAGVCTEPIVLCESHRIPSDGKRSRDRHFVQSLGIVPALLVLWRSHLKDPLWNHNHLRTSGAVAQGVAECDLKPETTGCSFLKVDDVHRGPAGDIAQLGWRYVGGHEDREDKHPLIIRFRRPKAWLF